MRAFDTTYVATTALACFVPLLLFMGHRDIGVVVLGTLVGGVGAAIGGSICRRWPGLAAPGWKLWLAAWLFNPVLIVVLGYILSEYECLLGYARGWKCMGLALAILALPVTLIGPTAAVIAHVIARRSRQSSG
ncbi:MAG: hypothetical protein KF889_14520 [Alphaproteobacteria bacterium]|nr:hypothetical protein [Alphaproteobacteria bacterium]MCW5738787.1 hypothetical protein [Alphaproteobacteria bacterium]